MAASLGRSYGVDIGLYSDGGCFTPFLFDPHTTIGRYASIAYTAAAFGAHPLDILFRHVLKNSLVPVLTRAMFSIPLVIISGSLLLETYFGIPGIGKATFDAITSGDQPVLKAVVGLTAALFVLIQLLIDIFYRLVDPRVAGT